MSGVDCCIAGGGPAGMMLGLLLARQGVDVMVLEKHGDFLRDFRGDTVHPSTLRLLDELGLADAFLALPHSRVTKVAFTTDDGTYALADFGRLPGKFPFLVFVPQWDFLDFLADQGRRYPNFRLRMNAEAVGLLRTDGQVTGLRFRTPGDGEQQVHARLTVAADGRNSALRGGAGLRLREFGAPMDVLWFRLPKASDEPGTSYGGAARVTRGRMLIRLDRGDYWQCAYLVRKGGYAALEAAGLDSFRADLVRLLPPDVSVERLRGWEDVRVLDVRVDRLTRWHQPGLLFIGDAAHAMSPIGGVGINLAVQDAAATARLLARPLRDGGVPPRRLARVRWRRILPTAVTQLVQRQIQSRALSRILAGDQPVGTPRMMKFIDRHPVLQGLPARAIGVGVLPEHAPPRLPERVGPGG